MCVCRICKQKSQKLPELVMETESDDSLTGGFRYLIVRPENGGITDLLRSFVRGGEATVMKFVDCSDEELLGAVDHRWVISVSVIARKIISVFRKPMEWTGCLVEFLLNVFSHNGSLMGLLYNLLHGWYSASSLSLSLSLSLCFTLLAGCFQKMNFTIITVL